MIRSFAVATVLSSLTTAALAANQFCNTYICVTSTLNGTDVNYVVQSQKEIPDLGWMAIGFGWQMANSPMVIMWPNSDGLVTLSQRSAPREVMPTLESNPQHVATLQDPGVSLDSMSPQVTFSISADSSSDGAHIWAFSSKRPSSSDQGAMLQQHDDSGTFNLMASSADASSMSSSETSTSNESSPSSTSEMQVTSSGASSGASSESQSSPTSTSGSPTPSSSSGNRSGTSPLTSSQRRIVVHAVLASIGFIVVLPCGTLLGRWLRTSTSSWYTGHWIFQVFFAGPLILAGFIYGVMVVNHGTGQHLANTHQRLGVALFALYLVQCFLGTFIHLFKPRASSRFHLRRPPQNFVHALLGLLIICLAFYQVHSGFAGEWPAKTKRPASDSVQAAYTVWAIAFPILYIAGLLLLRRQFSQEERHRQQVAAITARQRFSKEPDMLARRWSQ